VGLFGKPRDREEAMRQAEDLAAGRGLTGKLTRAFLGAESTSRLQEGLETARTSQAAASAVAAGALTITGKVTEIEHTGQLINNDPVVVMTVRLEDERIVRVRSLVPSLQIPRLGDAVALTENPAQPGTLAYAGLVR